MNSLTQHAPPILEHYQEIADVTGDMFASAQAGDWASVLSLGLHYCELVEDLKAIKRSVDMDETTRSKKHELLVRILANDANTRDLAVPQMARMGELLGRMKRQQAVLTTYNQRASAA